MLDSVNREIFFIIILGILAITILLLLVVKVFGFKFCFKKCCEKFQNTTTPASMFYTDAVTFDKFPACNKQDAYIITVVNKKPKHLILFSQFNPTKKDIIMNDKSKNSIIASVNDRYVMMNRDTLTQFDTVFYNTPAAYVMLETILGSFTSKSFSTKKQIDIDEFASTDREETPRKQNVLWAILVDKEDPWINTLNVGYVGMVFYDYGDVINTDITRLTLPYAYASGIDLRTWMPQREHLVHIFKLLSVPTILYTCNKQIDLASIEIYTQNSDPEHTTFFQALGFNVLDIHDIHENFEGSLAPLNDFTPSLNVPGTLEMNIRGMYKKFLTSARDIEGVMIQRYDVIMLKNQIHRDENARYVVLDSTDKGLVLESSFYTQFYNSDVKYEITWTDFEKHHVYVRASIKDIDVMKWKLFNTIFFSDLDKPAVITRMENTNIELIIYDDIYFYDSSLPGECVTNSFFNSKGACESSGNTWDRRCISDGECPFYQPQTKKGGCNNGYCEMPTGVQRVGYRKFLNDDSSYPRVHPSTKEIAFPLDFLQ